MADFLFHMYKAPVQAEPTIPTVFVTVPHELNKATAANVLAVAKHMYVTGPALPHMLCPVLATTTTNKHMISNNNSSVVVAVYQRGLSVAIEAIHIMTAECGIVVFSS